MRNAKASSWLAVTSAVVLSGGIWQGKEPAMAQIIPDDTLGAERSRVTPNVTIRSQLAEQIEGGALRGATLFHSFRDFNVNAGQRVYFSNPVGVEAILSRVTGRSPSSIQGLLGVNGAASLFLLNPNGIVFGPEAQLDIRGSFVSSTASSLSLGNGLEFSATNPQAPPLMEIHVQPGLQHGTNAQAAITNLGALTVRQDLTLAATSLTLEGQLQAGGTMTLHGLDSVQIRDRPEQPFIARAGGQLLVQGDRAISIAALSHPNSGLFAGGDLILRSANPVGGDAHYTAGGNVRIEQLNGELGDLESPNDPVIRANGNVSFDSYTGASLHIFAAGAVQIGQVEINAADAVNGISETVLLSDGTSLTVSGGTRPTLDIRAGTTAVGDGLGPVGTPLPTNLTLTESSNAAITVDRITVSQPNGLVYLTNQYQPRSPNTLGGDITVGLITVSNANGGGSVVVDSRGGLTVNGGIDASGGTGAGGDIRLLAAGDMLLNEGSSLQSVGATGGAIALSSGGSLSILGGAENGSIVSSTTGNGTGRDINLRAASIFTSGDVLATLEAGAVGQGGNLTIQTGALTTDFVTLATLSGGEGNAGRLTVNATDAIALSESTVASVVLETGIGNSGDTSVTAQSINAVGGSQIGSFTFGQGDSGDVTVTVSESAVFDGIVDGFFSGILSSVQLGAVGNGGNITFNGRSLTLTNSAQVRASTEGEGNAGNIQINATDFVVVDGAFQSDLQQRSAIVSEVFPESTGRGGSIRLTTGSLSLTNGGIISATTASAGDAGNLDIRARDAVLISGALADTNQPTLQSDFVIGSSGLFARTFPDSTGNGGSIAVTTGRLTVEDGGRITVGSDGAGIGGNVGIVARSVTLDGDQSGIFAQTRSTDGGNIALQVDDVLLLRNGSQISTTAGTAEAGGNGGNIQINAAFVAAVEAENSDITANAFTGRGGNINIATQSIFGLTPRTEQGSFSDITASSQFGVNGVITITRLDVDPSEGLVDLPDGVVDASSLVAQGCGSERAIAAGDLGEFVVTGRGGIPASPTERLSGEAVLANWEPYTSAQTPPTPSTNSAQVSTLPDRIVEAQAMVILPNGQPQLVAHVNHVLPHTVLGTASACPTR
jgi:filamentous hemagglutinin family protein